MNILIKENQNIFMLIIPVPVCSWLFSLSPAWTISSHWYHFWHISPSEDDYSSSASYLCLWTFFIYHYYTKPLSLRYYPLLLPVPYPVGNIQILLHFSLEFLEASLPFHIAMFFLLSSIDQCRMLFVYASDTHLSFSLPHYYHSCCKDQIN